MIGVVIGAMVYQLSMPIQFSIGTHYELEYRIDGTPITSYDFGEFQDDETKILNGTLHNLGTVDHNTTWICNVPSGWTFSIDGWALGTYKLISVDGQVNANLTLTEINAYAGSYNADLNFTVSD